MSQSHSTRIVSIAVVLLMVTAIGACKGTQAPREPASSSNYSSDTKATKADAGPTQPERRIALVVGNSDYRYVSSLRNPHNDAVLVAKALRTVGFQLIDGGPQLNLDKPAFDRAIQDFGNALQSATTALFYYAGHGMSLNDSNYLIPTSANPTRESDVDFQMVDIETVLHQMEDGHARLNVLILDACRNNPFGGRGLRAVGGGLGQTQAPDGTYIQYSAQPHAVAIDGDGEDSPYSEALAKAIYEPGIDIYHALNQVALAVEEQTGRRQQPWLEVSPIRGGDFYFVKPPRTPIVASVATPASAPAASGDINDTLYWMSVQNSNNPEFLKAYLRQFPNGHFADLARLRLQNQQGATTEAARPSPQPALTPFAGAVSTQASRTPTAHTFTALAKTPVNREGAKILRQKLRQSGYKLHLLPTQSGEERGYRIEIGPFATQADADAAQTTLDELTAQVASAPPAVQEHAAVQFSPALPQPAAQPTYTAQPDRIMDYNGAVSMLMSVSKLGYEGHLVPKTVNGQGKYGVEVGSLPDEKTAAQVRRRLDELAAQSNDSGSVQPRKLEALPPLALSTDSNASESSTTEEERGPYKIQVEDTFDSSRAQNLMKRLHQLGYKPQLIALQDAGRKLYHIEIGGFPNEDAAESAQDELQRRSDAARIPEQSSTKSHTNLRSEDGLAAAATPAVRKAGSTPVPSAPSQLAKPDNPGKDIGIVFSAGPDPVGNVNPKAFAAASHYNRGNDLFAANDFDAASEQFRKAVDLDPTNADAYYAWGLTLYAKRDPEGSIANFRRATMLKPDYPDAYYNWGLALDDLGEFSAAIPKFEKAVELRPSYADAYYDWGLALSRTGNLDGAIDKFRRATNLKPQYADAYYAWGVALYRQQRLEESMAKYRRALELKPANQTYKMALASALTAQQNSSGARHR